jgi:GWxTD domain-containing protein
MMGFRKNLPFMILLLTVFLLLSVGCFLREPMKQDPFYDTFFEKARLIMTDEEIEMYKQLPDRQSKEEFIEEFWKIRDPYPGTEENEYKIVFEERIEYANKWFGRWDPYRGKERYDKHARHRGWDTDRGRIYIILGPPDELYFDGERMFLERHISRPDAMMIEQWYYYRFHLMVYFVKGTGGKWIANWNADLQSFIEKAKLNIVEPSYRDYIEGRLKFEAVFKENHIQIFIPITRINFEERGDKLYSEFKITMNVYLDHKKIDSIEEKKSLNKSEEELLETDEILFEIPYEPKLKGDYLFDIIVEDFMAVLSSKYRKAVRYKLKD